jgi:ribonuclease-3
MDAVATKEKKIGVTFTDKSLLTQAFTHRSFINENRELKREHNERLEFLGDAVLELVSTQFLYEKYPQKHEGDLTAIRAALVNTITISDVARELGFNDELLLSKGESRDEGRARQAILANTYEAVIGAVYLDQGYEIAADFIIRTLLPRTDHIVKESLWIDSKSFFQERAQERFGVTPIYKTVAEEGPDHDKQFTVAVFVGNEQIAKGTDRSKQGAEQVAAREGLDKQGWI